MSNSRVLWIDLCPSPNGQGLVADLPPGYVVRKIEHGNPAAAVIRDFDPAVVCVEFAYPDTTHLRVIPTITRQFPALPVLMFTEFHSEALAIWAFRSGVRDYRVKPVAAAMLARLLVHTVDVTSASSRAQSAAAMPAALVTPEPHLFSPPETATRTAAAVRHVAAHYGEPISQATAASLCHLSASAFSRAFRREHHATFERFLLEFRIAKSRDLLLRSRMNITQVAHAVGFNDAAYFARVFRQLVGTSASEWRTHGRVSLPASAA